MTASYGIQNECIAAVHFNLPLLARADLVLKINLATSNAAEMEATIRSEEGRRLVGTDHTREAKCK